MSNYKVADLELADAGRLRIEWAESRMPVLMALRDKARTDQPLAGMRVAGCLHVTKEIASLIRTIIAAGAEVSWSGCNPLSTNDLELQTMGFAFDDLTPDQFAYASDYSAGT